MRIWEVFPETAMLVRKSHEDAGLHGHHDYVHACRVGDTAYQIGLKEWMNNRQAELAGLAGLCHNADRVLQKTMGLGRGDVPHDRIIALLDKWFPLDLATTERTLISQAILRHDGKNDARDSHVQILLMDADRIINLDLDLLMRSGQFFPDLPAVDYVHFASDPEATYRNPKSVLRDIAYAFDWVDPKSGVCIRTNTGLAMAESRVSFLRKAMDCLRGQLEEEGMCPFPFR